MKDVLQLSLLYMFAGAWITFQVAILPVMVNGGENVKGASAITVLFFGDSLTAAYGLGPEQGFPGLIQNRVAGLIPPVRVIIAGVSGETTAGGVRRIGWLLKRKIDVLVLALGGNDGLRGIDPSSTRGNLQEIINRARTANPSLKVILAGMEAPPNMGVNYTTVFRKVFREVAEANGITLLPFLLEGVAAVPELNLADGIHPNAAGHRIVADHVWKVLGPILESMRGGDEITGKLREAGKSEKGNDAQILENRQNE